MSGTTLAHRKLRAEALSAGINRFYTGRPCKHGHVAGWITSSGKCAECARLWSAAKDQRNPDGRRVRWAAYRARLNAIGHSMTPETLAKGLERLRRWQQQNPDRAREIQRRWVAANPEKARLQGRLRRHTRRARERASGGILSHGLAERLLRLQRDRCAACRNMLAGKFHLDHIIPIAAGGENEDKNMQILCPTCNLKKGAKHPVSFMQSMGFLL